MQTTFPLLSLSLSREPGATDYFKSHCGRITVSVPDPNASRPWTVTAEGIPTHAYRTLAEAVEQAERVYLVLGTAPPAQAPEEVDLAHGARLSFEGRPYQVCTTRGFWQETLDRPGSYYEGQSLDDLVAASRERHPYEPEHSIFACAMVLYDGPRREEEPRTPVEIGQVVTVEGVTYRIAPAANRNLRFEAIPA